MSCNGCRVLRKGCSESCILRPCLQWIHSPESQSHATVFVAKFFGRAGLMSFISSVPERQRPAIFQSLLFEACGRTVNPVNGAVGLLWTGNWRVCQSAVDTILRGGTLQPLTDLPVSAPDFDDASAAEIRNPYNFKRDKSSFQTSRSLACDLDLSLMSGLQAENSPPPKKKRRPSSPSEGSSSVTSSEECDQISSHQKLLNLFL